MTQNDDKEEALVKLELRLRKDLQDGLKTIISELGGDIYSIIRLPLVRLRVRQLTALAHEVAALRTAMGNEKPTRLPAKVQRLVIEEASVEEDPNLQTLWAQLIANQQAGMSVDAYLYEILTKITSQEAQQLAGEALRAVLSNAYFRETYLEKDPTSRRSAERETFQAWLERKGHQAPERFSDWSHPTKLVALGLLEPSLKAEANARDVSVHESHTGLGMTEVEVEVSIDGYVITDLAVELYHAACLPWSGSSTVSDESPTYRAYSLSDSQISDFW